MGNYGFWPYYVNADSYQPDWSKLDTVIYFYSDCDSDGNVYSPNLKSNYINVRDQAHKNGKKVIISIWSATPYDIDNILANHQEEFADNILKTIQENGADGVNLDLEYPSDVNTVTKTLNIVLFEQFMKTLNTKLKTANPNYEVSFCIGWATNCVPSMTNKNLSNYIDKVILMAYDYHGYVGAKSGANSPYNDPKNWDVIDSVNYIIQYYDKDKIIVTVPFYCYDSVTIFGSKGSTVKSLESIPMTGAISLSKNYNIIWDSASHTPWFKYQKNGVWHQVWFDNTRSLKLKADYEKTLGGIGYYPLGSEPKNIWRIF